MNSDGAEVESEAFHLAGYVFDEIGFRRKLWGDTIAHWDKLTSVSFGGSRCDGRRRRILNLEFERGVGREIVVKGGSRMRFAWSN